MSENSQLAKKLKEICEEQGAHYQRFTDKLWKGIPDSNICFLGREAWVELKLGPDAALSKEQKIWLNARKKVRGRVFVLYQLGNVYTLWNSGFKTWPKSPPLHVWSPRLDGESLFKFLFG